MGKKTTESGVRFGKFPMTEWNMAILRDERYIEEGYEKGWWHPYFGNYLAVVDCQPVGHGLDANVLRDEVVARLKVVPERVVITYVDPPINVME